MESPENLEPTKSENTPVVSGPEDPHPTAAATSPLPAPKDGVSFGLAAVHPNTLITETALARALGTSPRSVRRMVARNDLPPPFALAGKSTWFAGKVLEHLARRAAAAAQEGERYFAKFRQ